MKKSVFLMSIAIFAMSLSACGQSVDKSDSTNSNKDLTEYCIVTFNSNGGSDVPSQKVEKGSKIQKPANPTKERYEFINWTYQGEEWSFIGYVVTEDMVLEANWNQTHYLVTFDSNGGTDISPQTVKKGEKATKPSNPTKTNYTFSTWTYKGAEWLFDQNPVNEDMTLVATWIYDGFEDDYSFKASLSNGRSSMNKGEETTVSVSSVTNGMDFEYSSSNKSVATIDDYGRIRALSEGNTTITVTAKKNQYTKSNSFNLVVTDLKNTTQQYGHNVGSSREKSEMIGALENYSLANHLAGIPIAQNDGYTTFSKRIKLATTEYIDNYGFGLLGEGSLDESAEPINDNDSNFKDYLHLPCASGRAVLNDKSKMRTNHAIYKEDRELCGYITSSFWDKKMNETKNGYVWYPVLAKDKVIYDNHEYSFDRPIAIYQNEEVKPGEDPNPTGLYNTWRVYVKTGLSDGIKYRYNGKSWDIDLDGRNVELEDYEFVFRLLLNRNYAANPEAFAYNIVGGESYFKRTAGISGDDEALSIWNNWKDKGILGFKSGVDETNGEYIQLTITSEINRFDAMQAFSSKILSPLPEEFIKTIGEGSIKDGTDRYGNRSHVKNHDGKLTDFVLSLGPYMFETNEDGYYLAFKKNNQWTNDPNRYNFAGIKAICVDSFENSTAVINLFDRGYLDNADIPIRFISELKNQPGVYKTKGDTILKLNINSCTQEQWDEMYSNSYYSGNWPVKPWMNNDNFLKGLFYSINRIEFADYCGMSPSINYFPDSYLIDENTPYNKTEAHMKAIEAFQTYDSEGKSTYGYSLDKAVYYFKTAVNELVSSGLLEYGTKEKPTELKFSIKYTSPVELLNFRNQIFDYFKKAFNDDRVCNGRIVLVVESTSLRYRLDLEVMGGLFDLLCNSTIYGDMTSYLDLMHQFNWEDWEDNSSLYDRNYNYGVDTSVVVPEKPLVYNGEIWSFDTLLSVVSNKGVTVDAMNKSYVDYSSSGGADFSQGRDFSVVVETANTDKIKVSIERVLIFVDGYGEFDLDFVASAEGNKITANISLTQELAQEINNRIMKTQKIDDPEKPSYNPKPFNLGYYGRYWSVCVTYSYSSKNENSGTYSSPIDYITIDAYKNEASTY